MNDEATLCALFDEIAERLAQARSRALMGEREQALGMFEAAMLEFSRYRDVLEEMSGYTALRRALDVTVRSLRHEQQNDTRGSRGVALPEARRSQRRARRAA